MRDTTASVNGRKYTIPEIWIIGWLQSNPTKTWVDAVEWWAWQTQLEEQWQASRDAS